MDFLSKLFKPAKSGTGPSPGNKTPSHPVKTEHETYVEFAREFVEELVENLPDNSGKNIQAAKYLGEEHSTSLASIVLSENSFDTTLPDLLQPESVYKKQTDTDTDTSHTTEYESAVETDAQDSASLNDDLISDEIFDCAENIVDQQFKFQPSDQNISTPETHVLKSCDSSDLYKADDCSKALSFTKIEDKSGEESILMPSDVFDDSEISFSDCVNVEDVAGISKTLIPLDISALCAGIANLDLDTSAESASVSLQGNVLEAPNKFSLDDPHDYLLTHSSAFSNEGSFESSIVQDNSLFGGDVDTIHLIETDENELSVLIIDQTAEGSELRNCLGKVSSIPKADNCVDATLGTHNSNTFREDTQQHSALHFVPEELGKPSFPTTLETFEGSIQLSTKEISPNADEAKKPTVEAPVVDINLTFEAVKEPVGEVSIPLDAVNEPAVEDINLTFEAVKEPAVEQVQEPVGEVTLPFEAVQEPAVEVVQELALIEAVKEPAPVEAVKETIVVQGQEPAPVEALTETIVVEVKEPSVEQVQEPVVEQVQKLAPVQALKPSVENVEVKAVEAIKEPVVQVQEQEANLKFEAVKDLIVGQVEAIKEPVVQVHEQVANLTFEAVKYPIVGHVEEPAVEAIKEPVGQVEEPAVEAIKEPVVQVQEPAVKEANLTFEAVKYPIVGQVEEPAVKAIKEPVVQVDEPAVKEVNLTFEAVKDPIVGQVEEPTEEKVKEPAVEDVEEPTVEEVKEPTVKQVKAPAVEEVNLTFEAVKQSAVEALKELVEQVKEPTVKQVQEPAPVEPHKKSFAQVKTPALAKALQGPTGEQVKELAVADVEQPIDVAVKAPIVEEVETLVQLPITPNRDQSFEAFLKQEELRSVNVKIKLAADEFNKTRVATPLNLNKTKQPQNNSDTTPGEIVGDTASINCIALSLPEQNSQTNVVKVCEQVQVLIQPIHSLDFGDLAAEAANISNDFLNASQEVNEDLAVGSLTVISVTKPSAMMDTGSAQKPDEHVNSVPLDVKWLTDGQNTSLKNRNSGVGSLKSADVSYKINSSPVRSSVVDCSLEDPFKRRSLLQNSPPREVVLPNRDDDVRTTPIIPTCNMEGAGESSDATNNHSEAGPDTAETCNIHGDELFRDPSAFEFLSSMASTQPIRDYRKESLYVKFDPLLGSAPVAKTDRNIPLPPIFQESIRSGGTALQNQIVVSSPRDHVTPTKNPALDLIDRLISLTPSPKKLESPRPVVKEEPVQSQPTREQEEMIEELHLLRELLDRQDQAHQEQLLKHKAELEELQNQLNAIKQQNQEAEEREQKLNKKIVDKAQGQKQMSMIMEEYEKTISRLVAEKEAEHQAHELEKESIIKEKDLALGHLTNIEIAFSDVHMKYERSKNVIEGFKKNEEVLQGSLAEFEATIHKQEQKYDMLKSHAMQQLESANQELDSVRRSQQAENAKLKAMLKKSELKTSSLEEMLEQKIKENQELASICDDLISKVGN